MRPTELHVIGRWKQIYIRDVQPSLTGDHRLAPLIRKLAADATIVLSDNVQDADDAEPLVRFLVKQGIPRNDIRFRYPATTGFDRLLLRLAGGLTNAGLSFGADVAERDEGLQRYFITTPSYLAVSKHKRHLVIGPKGSGKSALLRKLAKENPNSLLVTPEHYATDLLASLRKDPLATELTAFTTTWKYTLLVEIFRQLVARNAGDLKALATLRKFLVDQRLLGQELTLFERFLTYLRRITEVKAKVGPVEGGVGLERADELSRLFRLDELLALVPDAAKILKRHPFTIYLDELDQGWSNSETANRFLIALLTAAIQLRGYSPDLHVVVFLRSEIFELLKSHLPQLDKLRSDIEVLRWSQRELMNLIVSRAMDSLQITADIPAEAATRAIFPGTIEESGTPVFEFIVSRTSYRPREIIQLCNIALDIAETQLDAASIGASAALRAEEEFSAWKLEHIIAEHIDIHPELGDLLDRFRAKPRRLQNHALDAVITEILISVGELKAPPMWYRANLEPVDIVRLLYDLEVIGIERAESGNGKHAIWENYDFVFTRPKARPENSGSFLFHPALWKTLELI